MCPMPFRLRCRPLGTAGLQNLIHGSENGGETHLLGRGASKVALDVSPAEFLPLGDPEGGFQEIGG